jgi:hypothetical protein
VSAKFEAKTIIWINGESIGFSQFMALSKTLFLDGVAVPRMAISVF